MLLEAHALTAGYHNRPVLTDISLRCETGEFVGLIGTNGSGKSTLLRALSGVLKPKSGTVYLDGTDVSRLSPLEIARRVAFVPQQETAAFDYTARDVVLMGRYPHRSRTPAQHEADFAHVARALADADALHLAERPVTELSGGEHRRILLARALAQQAPLLLLDEPTAHLDITHQAELLTLVRDRTHSGQMGALAALHDLNQASEFCDRLILLEAGRIRAQGTPETVLTPDNLRAAYGAVAGIGRNPATGRPLLLSLQSARDTLPTANAPRVHVVCGGGSGIAILGTLARYGFHVTTGVLNRLDSDEEAARVLNIAVALEEPFSPISPAALMACRALIADAETVLVAPVPFGHGNLANLALVQEAQAAGKTVVLLGRESASQDFTGGQAARLLHELTARGAQRWTRLEDWPGLSPHGSEAKG